MATLDPEILDDIIGEYTHKCPHCPDFADSPGEWVVAQEDVITIVRRALSEALDE